MTRALITGIRGQDGGYLAEALAADGVEVHGVARPGGGELPPWLADVTVHGVDLRDTDALGALVRSVRPDEVYHLGGLSSVAASWDDPLGTLEQTGLPTATLLAAAHGIDARFVLAASAEIFGDAPSPQNEATPIRPTSPYGAAKALSHHLVNVWRGRGVHASSCILFNHESPRRPERFVSRSIVVQAVRVARGEQSVIELGNLEVRRDWGWAPDYVDALVRAMRHDVAADWVIGTGETHSVREFALAALAAAGVTDAESRLAVDPSRVREIDPSELRADAARAWTELGWGPTVTFDELVRRLVEAELGK